MKSSKGALVVPIMVITVGVGWLLTTQGYGAGIDWVWSLGLAVVGVLTLALSGIDKVSIVIGPLFLIAGLFSVLRQAGRMNIDTEVPILVIVVGVLLMVAKLPAVPVPAWSVTDVRRREQAP